MNGRGEGLVRAYNAATGRSEPLVPGRRYRVLSHDDAACLEAGCGGLVDRGELVYVASRFLGRGRDHRTHWAHSFRAGERLVQFSDEYYSLRVSVPGPPC